MQLKVLVDFRYLDGNGLTNIEDGVFKGLEALEVL